jgi:hypothetical protein
MLLRAYIEFRTNASSRRENEILFFGSHTSFLFCATRYGSSARSGFLPAVWLLFSA